MRYSTPKNFLRRCTTPLAALALLATGQAAIAQNAQGTLLGHVADPTGAAVPGAKITVTNIATGVVTAFTTTSSGDYVVPQLNPGIYSVVISAPGFQQEISGGLKVEVDHTLRQDFKLSVGSANGETVQVSSDTQMLQTDNATIGQVIDSDLIDALPSNGRDVTNLLQIGTGATVQPGGAGADWSYHGINNTYTEVSINGAQADSISYNIDGVYDASYFFSTPSNVPNQLAVSEFKVSNGQYGAQYGVGAAQVNIAIKSGTNQIHGGAYEDFRDAYIEPLNQADIANGESGSQPFHQNQFGGAIGGPVWIPRIYNGRDKTFWFLSYDMARKLQTQSPQNTLVPTAAELGGDFSAWPYPIYDPATTVPNPNYNSSAPESPSNSPVIRTAFAGNKIPVSRLDPTVKNMLPLFNSPSNSSCSDSGIVEGTCSNFVALQTINLKQEVGTGRLDQNFGAGDHVFGTVNFGNLSQTNTTPLYGRSGVTFERSRLIGLTWSRTIKANLLNQATIGYDRDHFYTGVSTAYGPNISQQVGFANTAIDPATFDLPNLTFAGIQYESIGGGEPTTYFDNIYQGVDTVSLTKGHHTWNFGIDFRRVNLKEFDNYGGTGSLSFNGQYTASVPGLAGSSFVSGGTLSPTAAYQGNSFADFLLGDSQNASGPPPLGTDDFTLWGNNWNLFTQDDWRLSDRLTLNLGLRWERPTALGNNTDGGFAINTSNGGSLVWANKSFVEGLLAQGGNPNYLGCCVSKQLVPIDKKDFAPRFGFAYRPPVLGEKMVVRGGYGIFYDTYNRYYDGTQYDNDNLYSQLPATYSPTTGNETQSTSVVKNLWAPPVNGNFYFSAPVYQFGLSQVAWPENHNPYNQQWSLGTEYALTQKLLLDVAYVGSRGIHEATQIYVGGATPPPVTGDTCNDLVDAAQATGSSAYCLQDKNFSPIDTRTPYKNLPPWTYANANLLNSSYDALQVQLIERPARGLQYHVNYSYSKAMDITSGIGLIAGEPGIVQNHFNPAAQYGFSASDQTHRIVASYSYELPAGRGHLLDVHGFNWLVGGWETSGIYQVASGFPFAINGNPQADQMQAANTGIYLANRTGLSTPGFKRSVQLWFDPAKYAQTPLGAYGDTNKSPERTPYYLNWDATFGKRTKITESQSLLLRANIFNLTNSWHSSEGSNPGFSSFPSSGIGASNFGSLLQPGASPATLWNGHQLELSAQYTF
jgi:hypothetical protein